MIRTLTLAVPLTLAASAPLCAAAAATLPAQPLSPADATTRRAAAEGQAEEVKINTQDKLAIEASFFAPKSRSGRRPGVLLIHDAGSDRTQLGGLASYLKKRNFAVLSLDLRGHGTSASADLDWATLDREEQKRVWTYSMRDVSAGVKLLRARKEVHSSNLTVVGMGAGCTLAARYAGRDENVRALILLEPDGIQYGFDLPQDVVELAGLPTFIVTDREHRSTAERLRELGHGENDGEKYIEIAVIKSEGTNLLESRRLPSEVSKWLQGQVVPKKGR